MSATNRGSKRSPGDFYVTPAYCVHYLLDNVEIPGRYWLEPCAGDGAIIRATRGDPRCADVRWGAVEKATRFRQAMLDAGSLHGDMVWPGTDFLLDDLGRHPAFSACIGNPPYSHAEAFLRRALQLSPFVAFLLSLGFLESKKRRPLFEEVGVPDVYVIVPRPRFRGKGSDACTYAWMIFRREWAGRFQGHTQILYPTLPDVPEE